MRRRLLRRRLSISAPRMIVRSHLPWPLRWVVALSLGFSVAIALWTFEFGKNIAGLVLSGTLEAWSFSPPGGPKPLALCQYARVEGVIEHPEQAVVKTVQVRVTYQKGALVATQIVKS